MSDKEHKTEVKVEVRMNGRMYDAVFHLTGIMRFELDEPVLVDNIPVTSIYAEWLDYSWFRVQFPDWKVNWDLKPEEERKQQVVEPVRTVVEPVKEVRRTRVYTV